MSLQEKTTLSTGLLLFLTILVMGALSIYSINSNGRLRIEEFRQEETGKAKGYLKDVVGLAYGLLENAHKRSAEDSSAMWMVLEEIRTLRYKDGDGYFWIINDKLPFPNLILHSTHPENEGLSTDDPMYHIITGKPGKNFHQEAVEMNLEAGEGFIDYFWVRPDKTKTFNKLAYSKYFKPLGWIISTGIYMDSIDEAVMVKTKEVNEQISSVVYTLLAVSLVILAIGLYAANYFSKNLIGHLNAMGEKLIQLSKGQSVEQIESERKDEVGQMIRAVNELVLGLEYYSSFAIQVGNGNLAASFEALSKDDKLGNALLSMRNNLKRVIDETQNVVQAAEQDGQLSARINTTDKEGAWKELSEAINNLLHSVGAPIIAVNQVVEAMSEGNLSRRYTEDCQGDIKALVDNLNKALENLSILLLQVLKDSKEVDESSYEMLVASTEMNINTGEITSAIAEMSRGAQSQVAQVDKSSSLIEGILKSSNKMNALAAQINDSAESGVQNSTEGQVIVDHVTSCMNEISTYSVKTNESIEVLQKRSKEITEALGVITEIAAQTNLLALNAAIEAAQAGDAGRGFSIVAEEIRKLAEGSKRSAQEIEKLVGAVEVDTKKAAEVIKEMKQSVNNGNQASNEASMTFKKISESTKNTLGSSEEIVHATKSQIEDINDVVVIIEGVVVIAEETAAGTEQIAASASELSAGMESYNVKSKQLSQIASKLDQALDEFELVEEMKEEV